MKPGLIIKNKQRIITEPILILLMVLQPLSLMMQYLLNYSLHIKFDNMPNIILLISIIVLLYISRDIKAFLLFIYGGYYSIANYSGAKYGVNYYMLSFTLTCILLITLPSLSPVNKSVKNNRSINIIVFIFYVFVGVYFFSVSQTDRAMKDVSRILLDGFIIAHAFSYYTAAFGLFIAFKKNIYLAIPVFIAGMVVGTRIGIILNVLCFLYFIIHNYKLNYLQILKLTIPVIVIWIILWSFIVNYQNSSFVASLQTFENMSFVLDNNDAKSANFTSGRNVIWYYAFTEINKNGIVSSDNIIGRGPASSLYFNKITSGNEIWFHNDFVDVMYCLGFIGLGIYFYCIGRYLLKTKKYFFVLFIIISAMTNGFMLYNVLSIFMILHFIDIKTNRK